MDGVLPVLCLGLTLTALAAASTDQTLTATEGGDVTFWRGLDNQTHVILSYDNVVLLNFEDGLKRHIQNNIRVENGNIIMTDVQQNDSNVTYKLQFYTPEVKTCHFKLNVTERQPQVYDYATVQPTQPSDQSRAGLTIGLIVAAVAAAAAVVAAAVAFVMYRKRKSLWNKICRKSPSNDLTNGNYHGFTSRRVTV